MTTKDEIVRKIIPWHRRREEFVRARIRLSNQVSATCRRMARNTKCEGEKCHMKLCPPDQKIAEELENALYRGFKQFVRDRLKGLPTEFKVDHELGDAARNNAEPFLEAQLPLLRAEAEAVEYLRGYAELLPVYEWCKGVKGFAALTLAQIIGEAGDLSRFDGPAKLWKRFGVGLVEKDGEWTRQRRVTGEDALDHQYSPARRSMLYRVGEGLVKAGDREGYYGLYLERKKFEVEKAEAEGLKVVPQGKIPKKNPQDYRSKGHVDNRAKRFIQKRLLRDLWRAWREAGDEIVEPVCE
jgi:hypothetical protein